MAELTKQALKVENNTNFPNNNTGYITPALLREFNTDMIDSMVDEIPYGAYTQSVATSIDALNQFTASATGLSTGSLLVTASAASNVITFTKGDASQFSVTIADTTNLGPLNSFTASAQISLNNLNSWTSSYQPVITNLQASQSIDNTKFNTIGGQSGSWDNTSLNQYTASNDTKWSNISTQSGSWDNTSLNQYTASNDTKWSNIASQSGSWITESETSSFARTDASNTFTQANTFTSISASSFVSASAFVGNGSKLTGITASISLPILDEGIPQGNAVSMNFTGSGISATIVGGTAIVSVNTPDSGTINNLTASFNSYTASNNQKWDNIALQSGSWGATDTTALNAFTASQNTKNSTLESVTASLQQQLTNIGGQSGSWITESETGSFAYINKDNAWSANQTFTNITAVSASFQYVQTTYETSSVIYSSGSNQFGDAAGDVQTLYGSTRVMNELTASGLYYPTADGLAGQYMVTNGAGTLTFDDVHDLLEDVRYGENITLGDPLYVSGSNGTRPVVWKADASNSAKMPVIYIASSTNVANTNTTAITLGLITGVTTTGYPAGTTIYVAEGGGWSSSRPSGSSSIVQSLGIVTKEGAGGSGRGLVLNPGPATLPNLQTGYVWAGNGGNQPVAVATSSFAATDLTSLNAFTASQDIKNSTLASVTASLNTFTQSLVGTNAWTASIDTKFSTLGGQSGSWITSTQTGSFATTGSNNFVGVESINDLAGTNSGEVYLLGRSGSLILGNSVSTPTYASLSHLSSSQPNANTNLIFKDSSIQADTIISGSNNIFVNPATTTAGFKRYIGANNHYLNSSAIPQISASMAFPITMSSNVFAGTMIMRGPVSSSTWTLSNNQGGGAINIGSSAANNAQRAVSGVTTNNNSVIGTLSIIANGAADLGSGVNFSNNVLAGAATLTLSGSGVAASNNFINDSNFTLSNGFYSSSLGTGQLAMNRNNFAGQSQQLIISGAFPVGATYAAPSWSDNIMFGGNNIIYTNVSAAPISGGAALKDAIRNFVAGHQLVITGSSALGLTDTYGSAFVGRWNANDGVRNKTNTTIFAVGTGINDTTRKTGFLIDSGSNTFIEGTLNVSGSTSISGALNLTGSSVVVNSTKTQINSITPNTFNVNTTLDASVNPETYLFGSTASVAGLYLGVYDTPTFNTDVELYVSVDTGSGIKFNDWDNVSAAAYVPWMSIAPNLGNNPAPRFTRGLQITGSLSVTGSASGNVVSMSVSSNTASMDLSKGNYFELTSSASPLRIELSNIKAGQTATLILSASVSSSIAFSSNVGQPSPGAYSGSAAASTDILSFVAFNSSKANLVATKNIV